MNPITKFVSKKSLSVGLSALALCFALGANADIVDVSDAQLTMNKELQEDIRQTLAHLRFQHYVSNELNDDSSERILDSYLKALDPNKVYFTKTDIKGFEKYRFLIDDYLRRKNGELGFEIFKIFRKRLDSRTQKNLALIGTDFDFSKDQHFNIDSESYVWKNKSELDKTWYKRIKNNTLQQLMAKTPIEEVRENLTRRYQRQRDVVFQLKTDEVFETFINAYARELGPHTQYMSDATAENFRISMSLSLEGIGAALNTDQDYTVINRIIKGGPAEKSGKIHSEDKVIAVGQDGEEMVNVIGWRLMDVVQMIRGDKGTKVKLDIAPNDAPPGSPPERLELVRDIIQLDDQAAKLSSVEIPAGSTQKKYSVISIPSFYSSMVMGGKQQGEVREVTADVRKLLTQVKDNGGSDGLVIDLRGNGGGSLPEAVKLTGLFIEQSPVVQIAGKNGLPQVYNNNDNNVAYDGPMIVLVNRLSASASEIFAAALQDYGRAIVVGERSFGKGTVQRVQPLRVGQNIEHESQVKFTIAQFFRINGGSTQHKGVVPDITLNSGEQDDEFGERSYDNALPWSKVTPALYRSSTIDENLLTHLTKQHMQRSEKSAAFNLLRQSSRRIARNRSIKSLSLNYDERKAEQEALEKESLDQLNSYRDSLGLEAVTKETRSENPLPDEDEHWNIVHHQEAAQILHDQANWNDSMISKKN